MSISDVCFYGGPYFKVKFGSATERLRYFTFHAYNKNFDDIANGIKSFCHFSAWESTSSERQTLDNFTARLVMEELRIESNIYQVVIQSSRLTHFTKPISSYVPLWFKYS